MFAQIEIKIDICKQYKTGGVKPVYIILKFDDWMHVILEVRNIQLYMTFIL